MGEARVGQASGLPVHLLLHPGCPCTLLWASCLTCAAWLDGWRCGMAGSLTLDRTHPPPGMHAARVLHGQGQTSAGVTLPLATCQAHCETVLMRCKRLPPSSMLLGRMCP